MSAIARARARAYLAKRPPAVAGQRGHNATFAAAARLVEFGLSQEEAWPLLCEFNARCQPPWSERDLRHKLADAFQRTTLKAEFAPRHGPQRAQGTRPLSPPSPPAAASPAASQRGATAAGGREARRTVLPALDAGTPETVAALAALRGLSPPGVALAVARGLVRFGRWYGHDVWFALDAAGRTAAARRLDGRAWSPGVKSLFLPGSQAGWAVGIQEADGFPLVALVEGGPDLLAAHHCLIEAGQLDVAVVAMLTGNCPLPPEALARLGGRDVLVIPHADDAGRTAGRRWAGQLEQSGARVRVLSLADLTHPDGHPVKDLCDLAAAVAADHPAARARATTISQP